MQKIDPSFKLMQLAGELGIGPVEFVRMCNCQCNGQLQFESVFEKEYGNRWYDTIIDAAREEIEETVVQNGRERTKKMWNLNTMGNDNRLFMVHRYINWAAAFFRDPSLPA